MNKVLGFVLAGVIAVGVTGAFAGGGCCAAGKAESSANSSCDASLAKLNLTDAQKAQVAELKKQCKSATSTSERIAKCNAGLEKILTAEQLAQWNSSCQAPSKGGCPMAKKAEKK